MLAFLTNLFSPPSPEKSAENMMWRIAKMSFKLFKDNRFREPLELEKLEQTERDRIFNEVVLSGLSLVYLMLETIQEESEGAKKELFRMVKNPFHGAYPRSLAALGIEDEHVQLWYRLMAMRCEEYRGDYRRFKKQLPKTGQGNPWIHVVCIGGSSHICRGKIKEKIFALMNKWCIDVAVMCEKTMIKLMEDLR